MLGFPNPAILAGGATGRTYEDFVAHITTRAATLKSTVDRVQDFSEVVRVLVDDDVSPNTYGTPWLSHFAGGSGVSNWAAIVRHSLPSLAEFEAQVTMARQVLVVTKNAPWTSVYTGINRNGYQSQTINFSSFTPMIVDECVFWSAAQNAALVINPYAGSGPVPYTGPGW